MVLDKILHVGEEGLKHLWVGGNDSGLHTITSCEVLRGNDGNSIALDRANKYDLGMIVGKVRMLNDLRKESPEAKRLVGGFKVQHKTDGFDASGLGYKVRRRRNSSEMEKEVCQTSATPT